MSKVALPRVGSDDVRQLRSRIRSVEEPLWDPIDFKPALEVTSLQRAKGLKCVSSLKSRFERANLSPRLGFNLGTGTVTVSVSAAAGGPAEGDLRSASLWLMLAMAGNQREVEEVWAEEEAGGDYELAANACLRVFAELSGVAVTERRTSGTSVVLAFRLTSETVAPSRASFSDKQAAYQAVRYGPKYVEMVEEGKEAVAAAMLAAFWSASDANGYIPDPPLKAAVSDILEVWFKSGLAGVTCGFRPQPPPPALYLHGKSGIGKSEFVRTLSTGLETVIRRFCDASQRVAVVKVPLNATRADSLKAQTFVRGLSDHSIERILEQSVCRGHLAVLHLEEMPADADAQIVLNDLMKSCVAKLLGRYPQYAASVLTVCTSNHEIGEPLSRSGAYGSVVAVSPPDEAGRRMWVSRCFEEAFAAATGTRAEVILDGFPSVPDMRQLHQWWLSLSHCAVRAAAGRPASSVRVSGEAHAWSLAVSGDGWERVEVADGGGGLFCCPADLTSADDALSAARIEPSRAGQIRVLADMLRSKRVSPGVLVLQGAAERTAVYAAAAAAYVRSLEQGVRGVELDVLTDEDAIKVFGSPSEIRGGLFAFIDDATNPNSDGGAQLAVVSATVNETGQFILRELLEQGSKSRNHRLAVSKSGVLFTLMLGEDVWLTPQLASRAHLTLRV
eukprot:TRINITY_DN14743_c0_g1_i1.p1 TRINITY_DN14743_c0_g1~~TRINITY_DN14743_c0_g1_i1.p1  ORF type:complete len:699 (+),score=216.41 TRINITY_DN14743_c0_g1_i1:79-2097(+)